MAWPWVGGPLMRQIRATHAFFFVPRPPKRGLSAHAAHWPQSSRMQPSHSPKKKHRKNRYSVLLLKAKKVLVKIEIKSVMMMLGISEKSNGPENVALANLLTTL